MQGRFKTVLLSILLLFSLNAFSQEKKEAQDSLIRLLEAESAQLQEINSISYRKVIGPARFFHNNTYLLCDTALWNVNTNIINAIGHVQIIQENTFLTSDKIEYIVDENLAMFRGNLVELFDKEGNILRTNHLDYNTKDSIATFLFGGAMKNKDGNLIESTNGEYRAKEKIFFFENNVQMFTDSVFIKSDKIDYNTIENKAYFGNGTTAWQEDNILSANDGEFDRPNDLFHFKKDSHILTKNQEVWSDTLLYSRNTGIAELFNNIQMLDTAQSALCFADKAVYQPQPMSIVLTKKPSVVMYIIENGVRDTLFLAADTLKYYSVRYYNIDTNIISAAIERKKLADVDPLEEIEKESLTKRINNTRDRSIIPEDPNPVKKDAESESENLSLAKTAPVSDSLTVPTDSLSPLPDSLAGPADSLTVPTDSLAVTADSLAGPTDSLLVAEDTVALATPKDTSTVTFIDAWYHVKVFKNDMQALCDSLVYTGIDSIVRLYIDPVIWNDAKHQFTADSIQIMMKDNVLNKVNLITNAFIASQEDSIHYNQIKGAEMVAYFKDNDLYRYDAFGGASMIFYLQEDSIITIMNQKEGKIISARIKEREIQKIKYIENLQNNALPVYNLPIEDQRLRGFNWRGKERPLSRYDVSDRKIRESQREQMNSIPFPDYPYTDRYFTAIRDSILAYKATSDSIRVARELAKIRAREQEEQLERIKRDSLLVMDDSLTISGSDSLSSKKRMADSLSLVTDSLHLNGRLDTATASKKERAALKRQEATLRKQQARLKKLEAREEKRAAKLKRKEEKRAARIAKRKKKD